MPLYQLDAEFLPPTTVTRAFDGEETLNRPYLLRVTFSLPLADALELDLDGATGKRARLSVNDLRTGAPRLVYHGVVAALELVDDLEAISMLRLHLVPALWQLGLGEHSRVFVGRSLPQILTQTLTDGGLASSDFELRLTAAYRPLPHVCQYRESRLAFLTRWLERVGAYYFFDQQSEREKLVITDDPASQLAAREAPVRFVPQGAGDVSAGEALRSFRWRNEVLPRKVAVTDYNYLNPALGVAGTADVVAGQGGDVVLFGVNVQTPDDAKTHAGLRAVQYLSGGTTYRAHGHVLGLKSGFTFDLEEHPRSDLNRTYLVTTVRHSGSESGLAADAPGGNDGASAREVYRCEIVAVEGAKRWEPPDTAPWPRIAGSVRARIDGPQDSEYAQLDENGCYLVRLMLDESALPDGGASELVRMLQPHAGNPEGMHFPLRKGTEVQVAFLKGDPDRPVITGAVPDATTPSPVVKSNRTQNVLQTGGRNRLEIEDQQGSEYVDLSSPPETTFLHLGAHAGLGSHNFSFSTSGDSSMHTGANRDITVGGKQNESVTGNVTENYHSNQTTTVDGALKETIDSGATQTIHAGSTQTIDAGVKQTVSGGETRTVTGGQVETLSGGRTQSITGSSTETILGSLTQAVTGSVTITSPAGHKVLALGGFELSTPSSITLVAQGGFKLFAPGGQTRLDDGFDAKGGKMWDHAKNQLSIAATRMDVRGVYVDVVGFKLDVFVLKSTNGRNVTQGAPLCLNIGGSKLSTYMLGKHVGLQIWGM